jgi:hypothetical protein
MAWGLYSVLLAALCSVFVKCRQTSPVVGSPGSFFTEKHVILWDGFSPAASGPMKSSLLLF